MRILRLFVAVCVCSSHVFGLLLSNNDAPLCQSELTFTVSAFPSPTGPTTFYSLDLKHPSLVTMIMFDLSSCTDYNRSASTEISVTYVDASDVTQMPRNYSTGLNGSIDADFISVEYGIIGVLYANQMAVVAPTSLDCAAIHIQGCAPADLCPVNHCLHGGTCLSKSQCACTAGYIGQKCEKRIEDLVVQNLEFNSISHGILHTPEGDLNVAGDVHLTQTLPTSLRRSPTSGYLSFQGSGGNVTVEDISGPAVGKRTFGLLSGLSRVFGGLTHHHGFSHTSTLHVGHHHNHNHLISLFNTHNGWSTNREGASLYYKNHRLHFTVNTALGSFRLNLRWSPNKPWFPYVLTSSYSPVHGLSLFANGHHLGSIATALSHQHNSHYHWTPRLCFGSHCHSASLNVNLPHGSYVLSHVQSVAASVVNLARNALSGLVGLVAPHPKPTTPRPTTTTTTTTTTVATTTARTTATPTTHAKATTKSAHVPTSTNAVNTPSTHFTATATSLNSTTPNQLLCYQCSSMGTDGACFTPQLCNAGEVCALFKDPNGYNHRCLDASVCSKAQTVMNKVCWECCTSSLCNHKCTPTVQCTDTSKCSLLKSAGFSVCADATISKTECKQTCGNCGTSG